ncbi:hypothetical protein M3J09_012369 [Ascochyta lentis]
MRNAAGSSITEMNVVRFTNDSNFPARC